MNSKPNSIQTIFRFVIEPFVCVLCRKGFDTLGHLARHFLFCHNIAEPFTCDICQTAFPEKSELNGHLLEHTEENPFECGICEKRFSRKILLNFHIREHFGSTPYICEVCEARFKKKFMWKDHMNSHKASFVCSQCRKQVSCKDDLKLHGKDCTGKKPSKCNVCGKDICTSKTLTRHFTSPSGGRPYKCNICEANFGVKISLNKHLYDHAEEKLLRCDVCKVAYFDKESFVEHLRSRHCKMSFHRKFSSQRSVETFCSACRNTLSKKTQSDAHVFSTSPSCDVSQEHFFCQTEMPDHFPVHSDEEDFVCDDCQKACSLRHSSSLHTRRHGAHESLSPQEEIPRETGTNELTDVSVEQKTFSCPLCNTRFAQQDEFNIHLRYHAVEKKWQCNVCEKGFYLKKHLIKHRLSHKGEKSFVCNKCQKAFIYKKSLKSHLLKHDETSNKVFGSKNFKKCLIDKWLKCRRASHCKDKPFVCSQCQKAFSYPRGLSKHMLTHRTGNSFLCEVCGKKFPYKSHLNKHCRAAHNSEKGGKPSVV